MSDSQIPEDVRASTPFHAQGRVIVVTGGGSGIGRALVQRFVAEGARCVVAADRDEAAARDAARQAGPAAVAVFCDVASEPGTRGLIETTEARFGPIDLFCANAGVSVQGGAGLPDGQWQRLWEINVMAHVHAARQLVPRMLARGGGHLLFTASAAGLLSQFDAPYAVTKHAALAFAEWLSIAHGGQGLGVSCLCPQGVDTPLFRAESAARQQGMSAQVRTPQEVAALVVQALAEGRFLILTHPETQEYVARRALTRERWLRGMRKLQGVAQASLPGP
ncbi:SDR family NAD(P)-dependent oxidoreductase [Xenophilus arseniciresistens]|uniref:SDR family NAD(P)-dependent oxidoreductase n=1 Tax=Xenophilus arseniciresistens TaxID=1283306 RepID=A0AAE3SZM0_9BURK|nr:SDR family oxidoreductase [Xenophilus arseniciresistens]MDA7416016.1 SDR family NAD(P)-dependent oxidoreductase [Xenophilus arseniciresistens]